MPTHPPSTDQGNNSRKYINHEWSKKTGLRLDNMWEHDWFANCRKIVVCQECLHTDVHWRKWMIRQKIIKHAFRIQLGYLLLSPFMYVWVARRYCRRIFYLNLLSKIGSKPFIGEIIYQISSSANTYAFLYNPSLCPIYKPQNSEFWKIGSTLFIGEIIYQISSSNNTYACLYTPSLCPLCKPQDSEFWKIGSTPFIVEIICQISNYQYVCMPLYSLLCPLYRPQNSEFWKIGSTPFIVEIIYQISQVPTYSFVISLFKLQNSGFWKFAMTWFEYMKIILN